MEKEDSIEMNRTTSQTVEETKDASVTLQEEPSVNNSETDEDIGPNEVSPPGYSEEGNVKETSMSASDKGEDMLLENEDFSTEVISLSTTEIPKEENILEKYQINQLGETTNESSELASEQEKGLNEDDPEPVFDGIEVPDMEESMIPETQGQGYAWPEKAVALKDLVRKKSVVAVSTVLRRLSGKMEEGMHGFRGDEENYQIEKEVGSEAQEGSQKIIEKSWNPLLLIRSPSQTNAENKAELNKTILQPIALKGRILLYTKLGCHECIQARLFLQRKKLRYCEINIDIYPGRKLELERVAGSSAVPRVFFNEICIGGLNDLKNLNESGKLDEKLDYVITESPAYEAPIPPLSGEDDASTSGSIDELASIVIKMKDFVTIKDRFYKLRRFKNCFLGSEAVDFLSEDQYLEREEAVEFGQKLLSKLFFQHVLNENLFEDGNHLYRFLDSDPVVMSQCHNVPRGITDVKPKPIADISSRLRLLSRGIIEAYISQDGKHVDYRSIHGSEEFARYLRIVEELQRIDDLEGMQREEKLAFFINLNNMMAIHAILVLGHPSGPLERRKLLGDFKYLIGGCTYSLSAIQNGILRGNQRPPYNLTKPFSAKDKRLQVALPYAEPLVHFALAFGNRSGPAVRCYSPSDIDQELMEAARDFLRSGGLILDLNAKVALACKILKWYSADFGKNESEVMKHVANYMEPTESESLLELISSSQLKVVYQSYDWASNI
ncbi:uncharacterized protein LOC124925939 [Impatiens glandulifera]|uniref:uncharacterized protein LOC124925939 n=1 Tax=Impatiens glandulifera TaxID=253017 RepID=UPI001FB1790C|nr:uncharacterized protein LOC124925939 [Impatiens glandulifera]